MKFMFFSGVSPLEKVKIKKSCGILILEKTENSLESVLHENESFCYIEFVVMPYTTGKLYYCTISLHECGLSTINPTHLEI